MGTYYDREIWRGMENMVKGDLSYKCKRYVNIVLRSISMILGVVGIVCLVLLACSMMENQRTDYFGFNLTEFSVVEEKDTHGGFHGDGSYYLILDCSQNSNKAHEIIKGWTELPLSDNLDLAMYGGEKGAVSYGYKFAEDAHWPTINNGFYKFVDRHSESVNESDDTNLLNRHSFNFSVAIYDLDTETLYYFEIDT